MRRLWENEYVLRSGDFDKFNRIKPAAVLDLFQDAAGQHAAELGLGFDQMLERSYLWVMRKIKFRVLSAPMPHQRVVVKTWPLAPGRLSYRREYAIESLEGQRLIVGSSEWVVIHSQERKLLSVPDLYPFTDGFHEEMMFEGKLGKVPEFPGVGEPYTLRAGFSDLDANGHVNNARYAAFVLDALAPDRELDTFQIDYRKEVLHGTTLELYQKWQDQTAMVKGQNENGETMFACKLEYKG